MELRRLRRPILRLPLASAGGVRPLLCLVLLAAGPSLAPAEPLPAGPAAAWISPAHRQDSPAEKPADPPADPGPRVALGGLRCIKASSAITFVALPDRLHTLEWIQAFPLRSRSSLAAIDTPGGRRLRYEFGSRHWDIAPGSGTSVPLAPDDGQSAAREFALRRAYWAWPAGLDWQDEDSRRRCELGSLGSLSAEDFEDGRPTSLRSLTPDGAEDQALRNIRWEERDGRVWPVSAELWTGPDQIWSERLVAVETRQRFLDAFFQPPDRRPPGRDQGSLVVAPRPVQLPPVWVRTRPLGPGEDGWTSTGSWAERQQLAQGLEGSGWTLGLVPDLQLDENGKPEALRWTAAGGEDDPAGRILRAHGWRPDASSGAIACPLQRVSELHPGVWSATRRRAFGEAKKLLRPYLRRKLDPEGRLSTLELIQPFGPE